MIHKSFEIGQRGESLLADSLNRFDLLAKKDDNKDNRHFHDVIFNYKKKKYTVEVKYDLMAEKTGNIAIETYNPKSNKPSGINITKAHFWCHILPSEGFNYIFMTTVKRLKNYVAANKPKKIIECGGDKNATLYLYDDAKLLSIFNRIDSILSKKEFEQIFKQMLKEV